MNFTSYTAVPFDKNDVTTSVYKAGHVYCNLDFNAISVAYADHNIGSAKAIEIGEFADKSVCNALKNLSDKSSFGFKGSLAKSESGTLGSSEKSRKIIVYYSLTETTAKLAGRISAGTGAELFRLECKVPYSKKTGEAGNESKDDKKNGAHRELAAIPELSSYDVIFVGTPVWSDDVANPVETWLLKADLNKKTVVPFCTYWSTGNEQTLRRIAQLSKGSKILEGISQANGQVADVSSWLKKIGMKK